MKYVARIAAVTGQPNGAVHPVWTHTYLDMFIQITTTDILDLRLKAAQKCTESIYLYAFSILGGFCAVICCNVNYIISYS